MLQQYVRGKLVKDLDEEKRGLRDKRNLTINESFNNIKTVKLFGWEANFVNSVGGSYSQELKQEENKMLKKGVYLVIEY